MLGMSGIGTDCRFRGRIIGFGRFRVGFGIGGRIVGGGLPAGFPVRRSGGSRRRLLRRPGGIATSGHGCCRSGRSRLRLKSDKSENRRYGFGTVNGER